MNISRCSLWTVVVAFLGVSLLLWPVFVLASAVLGYLFSDAELLTSFQYQPKRLMLFDFFEGYKTTLPYTTSMAIFSVLILLLYRNAVFRSIFVIAIPGTIVAILLLVYLPFTMVGVLLVLKLLLLFLFFYAVCAYALQRCGHA